TRILQRDVQQASRSTESPGEPIGDVPTIGLVVRALSDDAHATTHWSARVSSALTQLRHWCGMDRQLELGRTAIARGEWSVAEAQLVEVVSRKSVAPSVLVRAWLCLADCAEQRRDHARELECSQRAVDLEQRLV